MYLRFVTLEIDPDSHSQQGTFTAAYALLESGDLNPEEWTVLREALDWFNEHLPHPPKKFTACRAIFWFHANAKESIGRMWNLVHLLRQHGRCIESIDAVIWQTSAITTSFRLQPTLQTRTLGSPSRSVNPLE